MSTAWARRTPVPLPRCKQSTVKTRRAFIVLPLAVFTLITACAPLAPASAPPQLQHTPGIPVVVTENHVDAGIFRLDYPPSWRVAKLSPAAAERIELAIIAPDGGSVSLAQLTAPVTGGGRTKKLKNGVILHIAIKPAESPSVDFASRVEKLVTSIRS